MLTDPKIRGLKAGAKPYKLGDTAGLYVLVQPNGAKLWRLNYTFAGKRKTAAFGAYPAVGLREARAARDEAKALLRQGQDPGAVKKQHRTAARQAVTTFEMVGAKWLQTKLVAEGKAASTIWRAQWLLDMFGADIGGRPINLIEAPELLAVLRRISARGEHETVKRLRETASRVFRFGIASGVCARDPAADLKGALTTGKSTPRAAIIDEAGVGQLLRAIDHLANPELRLPLQLLALVFVRPGELVHAEWSEFDLDAGTWTISAAKMKMRTEFRIPLPRQAIAILKARKAAAGASKWVFPSQRCNGRGRPIHASTLNYTLRNSLGYRSDEATLHGFRSTASSILHESGKFSVDAIELSLAHKIAGVRGVYMRSKLWPERCQLMQWYADELDRLRGRGKVVALPATKRRRS